MQENIVGELDVTPSFQLISEQLDVPSYSAPELNDKLFDLTLEDHLKSCYESNLDHSDNGVGNDGSLSSEYIVQPLMRKNGNGSIDLNVAPVGDCISHDSSLKFPCNYLEACYNTSAPVPNSEASPELLSIEKDAFTPALDFPVPDIRESFIGSAAVFVQKDENNADIDYNTHQSGDGIEQCDAFLSIQSDFIPDLNSNQFVLMASTHSSQSVSIESLEDSIADAKNKKVIHLQKLSVPTFLEHLSWAINFHVLACVYVDCT
jgi:hypothetical protein